MLSKKQFLERLQFFQDYQAKVDKFDQDLKAFAHSDFTGFYDEKMSSYLLDTLIEDMDGADILYWWLYEAPEGEKKIWSEDETEEWNVTTPEQLYNYIFTTYTKAPSEISLKTIVKAQDNGFKFALKQLDDLKEVNSKTKNENWKDRNQFLDFIIKILTNKYLCTRGTGADLNYKEKLYIISLLDEES